VDVPTQPDDSSETPMRLGLGRKLHQLPRRSTGCRRATAYCFTRAAIATWAWNVLGIMRESTMGS